MVRVGILVMARNKEEFMLKNEVHRLKIVKRYLENEGHEIVTSKMMKSNQEDLEKEMKEMTDIHKLDLILTIGGIGFRESDIVPEATKNIIHREANSLMQGISCFCLQISRKSLLNRGVAGIRNKTLIVNFPEDNKLLIFILDFALETILRGIKMIKSDKSF
ncbi:molybdopterin-binding protein [Clostridium sp.]|uniref:molybdopterin-binding protein n=1 Tax=Clostridium sp. TaxID=1506 RepID=UPI001D33BCBB|nr:molybdopterin-binding protein [Clostridium sp.]MBS5938713.1 molybdenum cofactor biosynthesis protein [Clostridium sp.]